MLLTTWKSTTRLLGAKGADELDPESLESTLEVFLVVSGKSTPNVTVGLVCVVRASKVLAAVELGCAVVVVGSIVSVGGLTGR